MKLAVQVERLRLAATALVLAIAALPAIAELSSDEINAALVQEGSVPLTWTNDEAHPWYLVQEAGSPAILRTPETPEDSKFTSTISFTYKSEYPTEITFKWYRYQYYSNDALQLFIDGEEKGSTTSNSWSSFRTVLPAGEHTVQFVSGSNWEGSNQTNYYGAIRNLRVWECRELESACLKEGSMPVKFENDPENMWITENGYVRSTIEDLQNTTTSISTTFEIDKTSVFSFEFMAGYLIYYDGYYANFYIDDVLYKTTNRGNYSSNQWYYVSVALYPGTHTIKFEYKKNYNSSDRWMRIRNVFLDQTWYDVTLNNPGELGVRLLQALGDKNLQDAELVKVKGRMNSDDWAVVRQLSGAKAIDLTETDNEAVPQDGFRNLSMLSTVMLPNTVKEIGKDAFRGTDFRKITIPASVETIGHNAWYETPLQYIDFEEGSHLSSIGYAAFYQTGMFEFIMPNSVTELKRHGEERGWEWREDNWDECDLFYNSSKLKKLHLSDGLTTVPPQLAYNCTSLEEVHLPARAEVIGKSAFYNTAIPGIEIPETVTKIGNSAFGETKLESIVIPKNVSSLGYRVFLNNKNLKHVVLNSHCWNMDCTFEECTALESILLPCATPPSIKENPFRYVTRSNIKLYVPDFALEAYKADPYWYNFTQATVSEEASVNDYWAIRGNLTLNSAHIMRGNPAIEVMEGGVLAIDDLTNQSFADFTFNTCESAPGVFLSRSANVNAASLTTRFYVESANKWYFFAPVADIEMSDIKYPATDSWVIRYYDGARRASEDANSGNWANVPAGGKLLRGQGYIFQATAPGWLEMPLAATEHAKFFGDDEVNLPLADNACETAANAGWNFMANPYPSYYDIYYLDLQAPVTVWTGSTYRAYSLNDGDRGDDTFVLRPMQPFFVQKTEADQAVGFPTTGRRTSTVINRAQAPRHTPAAGAGTRYKLNLEIYADDSEVSDDYTRIVVNEAASTAYEAHCDASKFMSLDTSVAQLYSLGTDSHPMAINERPYAEGTVGLGVYLPVKGGSYRIAATRSDRQAWLYDALTGIEHDLTGSDYIFRASKAGTDNKRFSIRFSPAITGIEGVSATATEVAGGTGTIAVTAPEEAFIAVYTTDGRTVATATSAGARIDMPAAPGVYIVVVNGVSYKTIVK